MQKKAFVGALCASIVLLGGCATGSGKKLPPSPQESYVDGKMRTTIDSIDQSLKVLVLLERGDQPARKSPPLGYTVAGAAGPYRAPISVATTAPSSVLDKKVRINWDGSAEQLLASMASQLGMSYAKVGSGTVPRVRIQGKVSTVRDILEQVANQTSSAADVRVDLSTRRIELIVH